jgi:mono/diheme cytochrome c family protein
MKLALYGVISLACFALGVTLEPALDAQGKPSRTVWDAVYSDEQAERGKALYQQQCGGCHGSRLEGTEVSPALAGGEFLSNWGGLTVGDLFERIRTTMPPNNSGSMTRDETTDVVAYLLSANEFPAGQTALPSNPQALQLIRIDATKPN